MARGGILSLCFSCCALHEGSSAVRAQALMDRVRARVGEDGEASLRREAARYVRGEASAAAYHAHAVALGLAALVPEMAALLPNAGAGPRGVAMSGVACQPWCLGWLRLCQRRCKPLQGFCVGYSMLTCHGTSSGLQLSAQSVCCAFFGDRQLGWRVRAAGGPAGGAPAALCGGGAGRGRAVGPPRGRRGRRGARRRARQLALRRLHARQRAGRGRRVRGLRPAAQPDRSQRCKQSGARARRRGTKRRCP